jgi:hypothetical protein
VCELELSLGGEIQGVLLLTCVAGVISLGRRFEGDSFPYGSPSLAVPGMIAMANSFALFLWLAGILSQVFSLCSVVT